MENTAFMPTNLLSFGINTRKLMKRVLRPACANMSLKKAIVYMDNTANTPTNLLRFGINPQISLEMKSVSRPACAKKSLIQVS